jgi:hypothetical protein
MKKFLIYTGVFWSIIFYVISKCSSNMGHRVHYYLINKLSSSSELFGVLFKQKNTNGLFLWCCDCIQFYANKLGYSYEEFNIILFIILQPALIFYFFTVCVCQYYKLTQKIKL